MCDECLLDVINRLKLEEIELLSYLSKNNSVNVHMSLDTNRIIYEIPEMTEFKFKACINRLEVLGLVGRVFKTKPNKFFIDKDGKRLLLIYKNLIKNQLGGKKE